MYLGTCRNLYRDRKSGCCNIDYVEKEEKVSVNSRVQKIEEAEAKVNMKYCTTPQLERLARGESVYRVLDWDENMDPVYELDEPFRSASE